MYTIIKNILFKLPPESSHNFVVGLMKLASKSTFIRKKTKNKFSFQSQLQHVERWGLTFTNPIGLAAGFDKQAEVYPFLESFGFGHIEIGAITPLPQEGNPKPRLYRLQKDLALINRMGFNSLGIKKVQKNFLNNPPSSIPIGINLGKNKVTSNELAYKDYSEVLNAFYDLGDYFTINISSPNTEKLRELHSEELLSPLLNRLIRDRDELAINHGEKAVLLKISPDLNIEQIKSVVLIAQERGIDGFIVANTSIARENLSSINKNQTGGLSGRPLNDNSTQIIREVYKITKGNLPIIGSGGVFNGKDAFNKISAGACMLQLYTSFIYKGPFIVKAINIELLSLMKKYNINSIEDLVGKGYKI